jgi:DNA adenine methylase
MPAPRSSDRPRPFLKWAGGKAQLLRQFEVLYPPAASIRRYVEPFAGSAAVFFHVRRLFNPAHSILSDGDAELLGAYRALQEEAEPVIRHLEKHRKLHSKSHYYRTRSQNPERLSPSARAARFIYLNRTCFNGLYRVNGSGRFNVPMGKYSNPLILDAENLRAVSAALRDVELRVAHFRETVGFTQAGDFIYLDPPYDPLSSTSCFTAYSRTSFRRADQEELAGVFAALSAQACRVMLSNSDTPFIRDLYRDFSLHSVQARRSINSKAAGRGRIPELVVLNYDPAPRQDSLVWRERRTLGSQRAAK